MDYDSEGLVSELRTTKQWLTLAAVANTLLLLKAVYDRSDRSRKSGDTLVKEVQNTPQKNERNWTARVAGSADLPPGLSNVARVQAQRKDTKKITEI